MHDQIAYDYRSSKDDAQDQDHSKKLPHSVSSSGLEHDVSNQQWCPDHDDEEKQDPEILPYLPHTLGLTGFSAPASFIFARRSSLSLSS